MKDLLKILPWMIGIGGFALSLDAVILVGDVFLGVQLLSTSLSLVLVLICLNWIFNRDTDKEMKFKPEQRPDLYQQPKEEPKRKRRFY